MATLKKHVDAGFQLIVFTAASVLLAGMLSWVLPRFTSYDQEPAFIPGAPNSAASIIRTGLQINSFSKTDILKNDFVFEGELWFEFDPQVVTLDEIEKFDIDHGQIIERSKPIITTQDNKTLARYFIRASFKTNLNYTAFPLDNHVIYIAITNRFLNADKITFMPTQSQGTAIKDLLTSTCTLNKIMTTGGYTTSQIQLEHTTLENKSPLFVMGITCNRIDMRHFLNIFFPLLLIFFFTLFAFSLDFNKHGTGMEATMAAAGVPALLAYRFVIESLSPDVDYFMLSDYLFFLFLSLVFAIFIAIVAAVHASERIKKLVVLGLYGCMLACCFGLFYWIL